MMASIDGQAVRVSMRSSFRFGRSLRMASTRVVRHARGRIRPVSGVLRRVVEPADGLDRGGRAIWHPHQRGVAMLYYAVVFFVVALIAAVFGFSGIAAGAAGVAKILFVLFLIGAVITFFISLGRRA
jgi:uncharacterized membrane protein YtjA (UPF0391 family)